MLQQQQQQQPQNGTTSTQEVTRVCRNVRNWKGGGRIGMCVGATKQPNDRAGPVICPQPHISAKGDIV